MAERSLEKALEEGVEALGFEFVELERTGSRTRPIFRLRIDLPDSAPGRGVTVDDCARVSRALETLLDEREFGDAYVLEVSSPGVDRPLVRRRDYERFVGQQIVLKGYTSFDDRGRRLEGELLGLVDEDGEERVRIRLADGAVLAIPREKIARAQLVFRWGD